MNTYPAKNIINVAMAGHSGAGKTSLAEAMLYLAGASDRRGKVGEGNTVCDSDPEEIRRKTSVSTAVAPFEWKNKKINLLDTPGLFDFQGGLYEAARAAESVVIVLAGKSGVSVGTEKAFAAAEKRGLSKIFFVNGLCDEGSDFYKVFEDLKASFGPSVCPIVVPYFEDGKADKYINMLEYKAYDYSGGKPVQVDMPNMGARLEGLRTAIYEAVAETSDELFEKYFSGEEFTPEEVIVGVSQGVKSGTISPVFCGDAMLMRGMEQFMDGLCWLAPSAADKGAEIGVDVDGNPVEIAVKEGGTRGIMSSFNRIGEICAAENADLLTTVLRNEWGFRGTVITDCILQLSYINIDRAIAAGNDLILSLMNMQAPSEAVTNSPAGHQVLRTATHNILYTSANSIGQEVSAIPVPYWLYITVAVVDAGLIALCVFYFVRRRKNVKRWKEQNSVQA